MTVGAAVMAEPVAAFYLAWLLWRGVPALVDASRRPRLTICPHSPAVHRAEAPGLAEVLAAVHCARHLVRLPFQARWACITCGAPPGVVPAAPAAGYYVPVTPFDCAYSGVLVHNSGVYYMFWSYRPFMTRNAFTVEIWAPNLQNINHPACPEGRIPPAPLTRGS